MTASEAVDARVRRYVYDETVQSGVPPALARIASGLSTTVAEVAGALERLASARVLVLQPEVGEILMAPPYSAVPTPFVVETPTYSCYANCVWDALGIPAMLGSGARIRTACGDCGRALILDVTGGQVRGDDSLAHFALPARHWWHDIVFN
jgi:hypothetical protein